MTKGHRHPPYRPDDPRYDQWPLCPFPTKKACNAAMSAWKREVRDEDKRREAGRVAARKAAREVAFMEYEASERQRIAEHLAGE